MNNQVKYFGISYRFNSEEHDIYFLFYNNKVFEINKIIPLSKHSKWITLPETQPVGENQTYAA